MQTAYATVHRVDDERKSSGIRLILDSGSQKSYITTRLRDKLQLPTVKTDKVLIKEFGNATGTFKTCDSVQIAVRGQDNLTTFINAYVVDIICSPISSQVIDFAQATYPHLRNLPLADHGNGDQDIEIDLLMGADFIWSFMLDRVVRGETGVGPVATLNRFGYVLSGPVPACSQNTHSSTVTIAHVLKTSAVIVEKEDDLKAELRKFWDYETLGIKESSVESQKTEDLATER